MLNQFLHLNTSNLDNSNDEVIEIEKIKITLSTSQNQKNNTNNNITLIDIGECEALLSKYYNLSDNQKLYVKKIDVKQEGMKIPKIEYDIYAKLSATNLTKLNISICENSKIYLSIPVIISENLDKLNASSDYFNDICYSSTSDSGTDISLEDRKKDFVEGNKTVCQENCDFSEYNTNFQKANCSCKVQESSNSYEKMNINKSQLYDNFGGISGKMDVSNLGITSCDVFGSKENIESNSGFYILLFILAIYIIIFIIFWSKGYNSLEKKMDEVIYKKFPNEKKIKHKNKKRKNTFTIKRISISKNKKKSNLKEYSTSKKDFLNRKQEKNKSNLITSIIQNKNETDKTNKNLKPDTDYELNWLHYEEAIKYDKRTNCEYYCSLIASKQLISFTFCSFNDYNSGIVKKFILFLSFALHYTTNTLFFTESTIHQIYKDKGKFNFEYQIPYIIYSAIISTLVLRLMLQFLVLTDKDVLEVKRQETKSLAIKMKKNKLNYMKIKFILFFAINFILLGLFWYYLTCFNAIYKNTQIYLIENTFISFAFSLFYPFVINIFPTIIRKCALYSLKKHQNYFYKFSQILQII